MAKKTAVWHKKIPGTDITVGGRDVPVGTPHFDPKKVLAREGVEDSLLKEDFPENVAPHTWKKLPEQAQTNLENKRKKFVRKAPGQVSDMVPTSGGGIVGPRFDWKKVPVPLDGNKATAPQTPLTRNTFRGPTIQGYPSDVSTQPIPQAMKRGAGDTPVVQPGPKLQAAVQEETLGQSNGGLGPRSIRKPKLKKTDVVIFEKVALGDMPITNVRDGNGRPTWMNSPGQGGKDPIYPNQKGKANPDTMFSQNVNQDPPPFKPINEDSFYIW